MIRWDFEIAIVLWIASLVASFWFMPAILLVGATTVNLWHQRRILFNAGMEFERRVRQTIRDDITHFDDRMKAMEKNVDDIKDSQVKIAGSFRGRQLP